MWLLMILDNNGRPPRVGYTVDNALHGHVVFKGMTSYKNMRGSTIQRFLFKQIK
tara:strand:+ start:412 stop:573 length:162 start_codon:yes stop_codon:yes gene_type:complete